MKETLDKIANILELNVHNINSISLLEGKIGIVLFFYHYGRYSDNKVYSDIADRLSESVLDSFGKNIDMSFDQGITGFAWAIRYLVRHNFAEGNPDEILSDIEDILLNKYIIDSESKIPISALGMYFRSMLADDPNIEKHDKIINIILDKYRFYFLCFINNPRPITYINSALSVLSILLSYDKYKNEAERIIFQILLHFPNEESLIQIDKSELKTLYKLLSSIKFISEEKETVIRNIEKIYDFNSDNEASIEYLWQHFFYFPIEKSSLDLKVVNKFIEDNYTSLPQKNPLSLYKGLAGIGLHLILQEEL